MDFFAAQENAKKKTRYLVVVYILVLMLLTLISCLLVLIAPRILMGGSMPTPIEDYILSPELRPVFLLVGGVIVGGALISSIIKSRHLSQGGGVIAASLGGVVISPSTSQLNERKVLNVVEEMAIASGMPVPEVYLLKQESDINAFAAGQTPADAVIGVTQGCIDKLTRDQLQGVVGHEFSHILNGDMKLNSRIIMLLHGIEFVGILGRILTSSQRRSRIYSSRRSKGSGAIIMVGLLLRLIGWVGVLFGKLVKAAVSRQREFLADASSVQFTRNPSAISGALKVIGYSAESSQIRHADASEVSHIFFAQSFTTRFSAWFATHPPIDVRIRTIEPRWDGDYIQPLTPPKDAKRFAEEYGQGSQGGVSTENTDWLSDPLEMLLIAGVALAHLNEDEQRQLSQLLEQTGDPLEAIALVYAIVSGDSANTELSRANKLDDETFKDILNEVNFKGLAERTYAHIDRLELLSLNNVLPLIELAMPALKQMSDKQYESFKTGLEHIMLLDGHKSVFEQSIYQLITHYLDLHFGLKTPVKVRFTKASQVKIELQLLFSVLTEYGHDVHLGDNHEKLIAYEQAMRYLGLSDVEKLKLGEQHEAMFEHVTETLAHCSEALKHQIVEAMAICVEFDGTVNEYEKELVLAIAATMDAPLPRLR